jgi:serpin B
VKEMDKKQILGLVIALVIIASAVLLINIDNNVTDDNLPSDDETPPVLGDITSFDEAVNAFAFDFYKKLTEDPNNAGNVFYSPYSVFTALAMTYEGARNNTAAQMENVLHIEQDNDSFHEYMQSLYNYLNNNAEYNISTANALWPDVGFELLPEYEQTILDYYGGHSEPVEYGNPKEAVRIINEWVENQTNNLIKNLVPENAINDLTRLILTNAIYFKGTWQIQFDEANTTDRDFIDSEGNVIEVPTMCLTQTEDTFNYTDTDELQILELPYTGDDISMIIFLPKEGVELSDVISSLNRENYISLIADMYKTKADIYLPKFKFETSYGLNGYLIELGMIDAFIDSADFSGINGRPDLYISSVLHKAFVEVNEEGTEAAAATAVIMDLKAPGPGEPPERITFDCNHPFLFTIHHKETGTILFMGSVTNPLTEN